MDDVDCRAAREPRQLGERFLAAVELDLPKVEALRPLAFALREEDEPNLLVDLHAPPE